MNYLGGIPAHLNDLTKPQVRASIDELFSKWEEAAISRIPIAPAFAAVRHTPFELGELVSASKPVLTT
jgi:hypothetical protein